MKVKRFILSVALPLFLAAVILSLGNMIPNNLLERQKENYLQRLTTVEVDDVRPYGDEYEETRQELLSSIHVLEDAHYVDRDTNAGKAVATETTMACFREFLYMLQTAVNEQGYPMEIIDRLDLYEESMISHDAEGSDMVLMVSCVDSWTGMITASNLDLSTGAPIQFVMAGQMEEYVSPWAVWQGVLAAYQQHCGLIFGEAVSELEAEGKKAGANETEVMEDLAEEYAWSTSNSAVNISAVSNDMTFRLEMCLETYEGEMWNLVINLRENNG